jgi:hypothetical protein
MGRIYVDKYTGRITRTDKYLVTLTLKDGTVIENLEPRRLFPISNTEMYISLLDKDEKDIALVRDLNEIDEESAQALRECFKEFYRIPKILRLIDVNEKFGTITWTVETDRGGVSFRIRNRNSDIKCIGNKRVLVRDTNDNRYEIPDYREMDAHSKHCLFSYI